MCVQGCYTRKREEQIWIHTRRTWMGASKCKWGITNVWSALYSKNFLENGGLCQGYRGEERKKSFVILMLSIVLRWEGRQRGKGSRVRDGKRCRGKTWLSVKESTVLLPCKELLPVSVSSSSSSSSPFYPFLANNATVMVLGYFIKTMHYEKIGLCCNFWVDTLYIWTWSWRKKLENMLTCCYLPVF